ncbi:XRE family transcriptional regulator [Actinoalloteichus sp. AHMU CJ021]|nr:XRE family transcriptional regulator [Actinoalloteichus sp. AHMU CJ021]
MAPLFRVIDMASTPYRAQARALGAELRQLRAAARLTAKAVGEAVGLSQPTISQTETGKRLASPEEVASILTVLGVTGSNRDRLIQMARDAQQPRWLAVGVPGLPAQVTAMIEFERTAVSATSVSALLMPGLLQTEDYIRSIMAAYGHPPSEREFRVHLRLSRQRVLTDGSLQFTALIDEAILHRPVGGTEVLAGQLRHLVRMSEFPNITVQVVPVGAGYTALLEGSFVVLEFPKAAPVVHLEHGNSGVFLDGQDDQAEVDEFRSWAASLQQSAVSPSDSRILIGELIERMEHAPHRATPDPAGAGLE